MFGGGVGGRLWLGVGLSKEVSAENVAVFVLLLLLWEFLLLLLQ